MKANQTIRKRPNRRLFGFLFGSIVLLFVPVVLQLTVGTGVDGQGFNWKWNDFVIMGFLLLSTGLLGDFVMRKVRHNTRAMLLCGVILLVFLLVWAELAIGIFNIPRFSGH
jgi:hypothetical protein